MSIIAWIIVIVIAISIIKAILETVGEYFQIILGIIAVIALIAGAIYLLKKIFKGFMKGMEAIGNATIRLICSIPAWILYTYCVLFLLFVIVCFIVCMLNVQMKYAIMDFFYSTRQAGTIVEIKEKARKKIMSESKGMLLIFCRSGRFDRMFDALMYRGCCELSSICCTVIAFHDFVDVLNRMGMGTDKEFFEKVQSENMLQESYKDIVCNVKNIQSCLELMLKKKIAKSVPLNQETDENIFFEPKLYISKNPSPEPEDMLPSVTLEID